MIDNLFVKAKPKSNRLKMLVYGETGTGKTVTSIQFPNAAVVDTQKGTEHYGKDYSFHKLNVREPSDPDAIELAIDDLIEDPRDFRTFVVDSMTDVYDRMVQKRLRYKREQSGNPHYEMQPQDWGYLKNRIKFFIHKLLSLDMNVIATAESKKQYSDSDDEFMKVVGTQPDCHKKVPYIFDVVLELTTDNEGRHWAHVKKDRTNSLPSDFEFTYDSFAKYIGVEGLEREADANSQSHEYSEPPQRSKEVEFNGNTIKTAGVDAKQLEHIENIMESVGEKRIREILQNDYFVDSVLDLKTDEADLLIKQITS